ncbi:DegV family protein [Bacillus sp. DJP31]|uniref:DegV family protein n=1 Tax=Bacillus sp. DJP31 TaxID=3409789 RepID=UPI003BB65A6D
MKIAWVTDSTVNLDEKYRNHPDIYSVPMLIMFNGEEFRDGIDLEPDEFFQKLEASSKLPTSSQPAVGTFVELYESLKTNYDAIIAVHVSSKLSGTYSTSVQAANMVDFPIEVIDSRVISLPMGKIIQRGLELQHEDKSFDDIVKDLTILANQHETYVLIGSLEQLHRGGRMNGAQYLIGSALKIKPILALNDGELKISEKVRTEKKAEQRMIDIFTTALSNHPTIKELTLIYGRYPEVADAWKQKIQELYPNLTISTCPLGAVVCVHAGANTIGISWYK